MDFICNTCKVTTHTDSVAFPFSARSYTPLNSCAFSIIEFTCPNEACKAKESILVPATTSLAEVPGMIEAAHGVDKNVVPHFELVKQSTTAAQ